MMANCHFFGIEAHDAVASSSSSPGLFVVSNCEEEEPGLL